MILTCPDCSTRYSVKDGSIGPNGRTVRCSNCSATWFVPSVSETLALEDSLDGDISIIEEENSAEAATNESTLKPAKPIMGAHVHVRDRADRQRRNRRMMGVSLIWIVTLTLLLAAALLGYIFRQDIVDRNPSLASVYKVFKIDVKEGAIDFEDPATRSIIIDGQPVLVVNGVIINRSNKARDLPLVELSLENPNGEQLTKWFVELDQDKLEARQRLEYVSQYPNPPIDAANLKFRFVEPESVITEAPEN